MQYVSTYVICLPTEHYEAHKNSFKTRCLAELVKLLPPPSN